MAIFKMPVFNFLAKNEVPNGPKKDAENDVDFRIEFCFDFWSVFDQFWEPGACETWPSWDGTESELFHLNPVSRAMLHTMRSFTESC